ncbi:MAG: 23S rRNA (guanosine(2251)-2'-O)-methyltransferase RlmB [Bacteroidales bacterium]|nr:23S rRNA (guanosine(2251)-2'-O)-methyltransferase RlmB [Bacteroidales bacterium]HOK97561.1 23S rRNA (guanosine(2251)-2'-O)-methyltransferase RlmB [Bacteroidales bacterium]HPO64381.1 23S rRNA (guanosine(2251)-2'-O)-methyltransferase RlmB [Bacteroidales bacterium]
MAKSQVIYGIHAVLEAIRSGKELERVILKKEFTGPVLGEILKYCRDHQVPYQFVPPVRLDKITSKNHQGVIAFLSQISYQPIEQIVPQLFEEGQTPFFLVLDHVTDVRNFGSIARTAECAGVHAIIVPEKGSALINADAIKTSSGALHTINVCRVSSLIDSVKFLKDSGILLYAATEKGSQLYFEADLTQPSAIVIGSEGKGISPEILRLCHSHIRIPVLGKINSLNAAVAAGIILYEKVRQQLLHTIK